MDKKIYEKITLKKEFSQLPKIDVEKAWKIFERRQVSDEEKIRLTRDLLRKVFSVFTSSKLLNLKNKDPEWFLKKHFSTRERFDFYSKLYEKLLGKFKEKVTVFDLGAGINGFSYSFFPKNFDYVAVESIGQLVELQNYYFKTRGLEAWAIHESLFNLEKIKKIISSVKNKKIIFLFKVLDSLEMIEKDYSKKLLNKIVPLADLIIVSFATKSLISKKNFKAKRYWFKNFVAESFQLLESFELGGEKYFVFSKR